MELHDKFKKLLNDTYETDKERYFTSRTGRIVGGFWEDGQLVDARIINEPSYTSVSQLNSLSKDVQALKAGKLELQQIDTSEYNRYNIEAGKLVRTNGKAKVSKHKPILKGGAAEAVADSPMEAGEVVCNDSSALIEAGTKDKPKAKPKAKPKDKKGKPIKRNMYEFEGGADDANDDNELMTLSQVLKDISLRAMDQAKEILQAGMDPVEAYNKDLSFFKAGSKRKRN